MGRSNRRLPLSVCLASLDVFSWEFLSLKNKKTPKTRKICFELYGASLKAFLVTVLVRKWWSVSCLWATENLCIQPQVTLAGRWRRRLEFSISCCDSQVPSSLSITEPMACVWLMCSHVLGPFMWPGGDPFHLLLQSRKLKPLCKVTVR